MIPDPVRSTISNADVSAVEMAAAELVWEHTGEICDGTNGSLIADIARAIMAAKAEERQRWRPAITYFDRYCQDEAEDVENCVCGMQQHEDAKAFAAIRREG